MKPNKRLEEIQNEMFDLLDEAKEIVRRFSKEKNYPFDETKAVWISLIDDALGGKRSKNNISFSFLSLEGAKQRISEFKGGKEHPCEDCEDFGDCDDCGKI